VKYANIHGGYAIAVMNGADDGLRIGAPGRRDRESLEAADYTTGGRNDTNRADRDCPPSCPICQRYSFQVKTCKQYRYSRPRH
jgi:hypothetical protein